MQMLCKRFLNNLWVVVFPKKKMKKQKKNFILDVKSSDIKNNIKLAFGCEKILEILEILSIPSILHANDIWFNLGMNEFI